MILYCKITNGELGRLEKLSSNLINLSDADLISLHSYYKYIVPEFDHLLQKLDGLYLDEDNQVVTKYIIDVNYDIIVEKEKIDTLLTKMEHTIIMYKFDWYATRKIKFGTEIPTEILTEESNFKIFCDELRTELNNFTDIKDVLQFNITLRINTYNSEYVNYINDNIT